MIQRLDIALLVIGIRWDREILRERIKKHLKDRLEQGIKEVQRLGDAGVLWERLDLIGRQEDIERP